MDWETEDGTKKQTNFRRVLLTKCQLEFDKDKKDDEDREEMLKSIKEAENVGCVLRYGCDRMVLQ